MAADEQKNPGPREYEFIRSYIRLKIFMIREDDSLCLVKIWNKMWKIAIQPIGNDTD